MDMHICGMWWPGTHGLYTRTWLHVHSVYRNYRLKTRRVILLPPSVGGPTTRHDRAHPGRNGAQAASDSEADRRDQTDLGRVINHNLTRT